MSFYRRGKLLSWTQAAVFFLIVVSTAAAPFRLQSPEEHMKDAVTIHGILDGTDYVVPVSIPCKSCISSLEQEYIQFDVRIKAAEHECSANNSIFFNNQPFSVTNWQHPVKEALHFISKPSNINGASVGVTANLQLACLGRDTSLISMDVAAVSDRSVGPSTHGVAFSFTQFGRAQLVRAESVPVPDVTRSDLYGTWGDVSHRSHELGFQARLDEEYQKLVSLEEHIARLHKAQYDQKHKIGTMILQEFDTCKGLRCYIRTATSKAPYLRHLLLALFDRHHTDDHYVTGSAAQIPVTHDRLKEASGFGKPPNTFDGADLDLYNVGGEDPASQFHPPPPPPPPSPPLPPSWSHGGAPPPPPPPPPPPSWFPGRPSHPHRPHHHHNDKEMGSLTTGLGHSRPGFRQQPPRVPFLYIIAGLILFFSILFAVSRLFKVRISCFGDPQRKRDRAARREERRNRAAYKRAACQQKFRRWWSSFREPEATSDYDEKRARILSQEGVLEHAMQNEITQLQRAHEMVTDLMRAEGQRQRLYHEINFGTSPASGNHYNSNVNGEGSSGGSIQTLPLYPGPPPSYESDLGSDMTVVDGFSYTSSNADNTESSVVDCSSRMSFETGSNGTQE